MKALITGIDGQDGSFLAELLLSKGYEVHGLVRRSGKPWAQIAHLVDKVTLHWGDMTTENRLCILLGQLQPDELYNLAAQSDVRISFDCPEATADVTALGVVRLLEAVRQFSPRTRFYQASTSELFGHQPPPQSEHTPMVPVSPYAAAKLYGHNMVRIYRESYGLFCCAGMLFNHESERRGENFVTRKVTRAVGRIAYGLQDKLLLGNLEARRDWGYAPEYVEGMWLMLQQDEPQDLVLGTGVLHTIKDLLEAAFGRADRDWQEYVEVDEALYRPLDAHYLLASPIKAHNELGWWAKTPFQVMIETMVDHDVALAEAERGVAGAVAAGGR